MFSVLRLKAQGQYEANKDLVDIILQTETGNLQQLMGLGEMIEKVNQQGVQVTWK
jgi:hypothetical protein